MRRNTSNNNSTIMSPEEFNKVMTLLVQQYPYTECFSINAFVVFDHDEKLEASNAGMLYEDYEAGYYWARDWVNGGAKKGDVKLEYAFLAVQHNSTVSKLDGSEVCEDYYLVLADKVSCDACPEKCIRTNTRVIAACSTALSNIMMEFYRFKKFSIGGGQYVWSTEDRLAEAGIQWLEYTDQVELQFGNVDNLTYNNWGRGTDGLRGSAVRIKLCRPCAARVDFNIARTGGATKLAAVATCDIC